MQTNTDTTFEDRLTKAADEIANTPVIDNYADMTASELTDILCTDLGTEITNEVVNMTTGLKVKLDMLDELKQLLVDSFPDIRSNVLTDRLATALALTKEAKGSSLHTVAGNLSVYDFLEAKGKVDNTNYLFMADVTAEATASLDILILEAAFRSYKAQIALGALPLPSKDLVLAVHRTIKQIKPVAEDNKKKVQTLSFAK